MAKRTSSKPAPRVRPQNPVSSPSPLWVLGGAALIVLAVTLAYYPALRGGFIVDDDKLLTDNSLIKASDGLYRFWCTTEADDYWPVANTTLWVEWRLWGLHSTGYHVTNLVLHLVEVLLIWRILWRLAIPGAFLAALLFAVHPVNVESVAWIAQRKSLLAMLFSLLSVLWYVNADTPTQPHSHRAPRRAGPWYWLSLGAFVLAMLSKVSAAVLPPLLLGIVWWRRPLTRQDLVRMAPFLLVLLVLLRVNLWFRTHGMETPIQTASVTERLLGAGGVVWFYLSKALLPVNLIFLYPEWHIHADQLRWWLPLLAAVGTTYVLWRYRRSWSRPVLFAWGSFCVALVPVLGFTDVGYMQPLVVADHYQHVALIAVMALIAAGWRTWQRRVRGASRWAANAAAVAMAVVLLILTWQQSSLYIDAMTLYQATLEKNPDSWLAHTDLGSVLLSQPGRQQEAIGHYEQALRLRPYFPGSHSNLAIVLAETGQLQDAIGHFQQALRLQPGDPEVHNHLGSALSRAGQLQEAIEHFQQALQLKLDYPDAEYNLGIALGQANRLQEAIEHFQQALRLKPDFPQAHYNLGNALAQAGHLQEAIEHFQEALRLRPDYPDAQYNLGIALAMQQRAADGQQRDQATME